MRSTRRWFVIFLVVALLVCAAWYEGHPASPTEVRRSSSPAEGAPSGGESSRAAARPSPAAAVGSPEVGGRPAKAAGRETQVCGLGTVHLDGKGRVEPFNYVDRVTGAAQSRWLRTLVNSDDNHQRAAGLLLVSRGWDYDSLTGMPTRTHEAVLARDELVQLAAGLEDVSVYAMAVLACDQSYDPAPRDTACDRISLAKWAAMDPDNAAPWLKVAAAARARSDQAAELDAVSHAARAHTIDFGSDAALAFARIGMPPETTDLQRAAFFDRLTGQKGGEGPVRGVVIGAYCNKNALQDASVRQRCEALAELLVDHGRNTFDLAAGATLGSRLGWSSERVSAIRQETLAVYRVESHSDKDPWSCGDVRAVNEFANVQARSGEMAAARAAIGESGKSIAQLAQEQLDSLRRSTEDDCTESGGTLKVFPGGGLSMCMRPTDSDEVKAMERDLEGQISSSGR